MFPTLPPLERLSPENRTQAEQWLAKLRVAAQEIMATRNAHKHLPEHREPPSPAAPPKATDE